ncbi:hypothetical protein Pmani_031713 [Petrolisthes manimaculis]|uniref:Uncharacterized protein n=1 Tax=Petrolisthes manimaculis TaxID=1843537 RepID=A0AAE1TRQ7_9EUCA|nr:hypothetical protein Pmani_031713 [Petrolisthes manimaculis]
MAVWILEAARLADDFLYNCLNEIYTIHQPWLNVITKLPGLSLFAPAPPLPPSSTLSLFALPGRVQELIRYRTLRKRKEKLAENDANKTRRKTTHDDETEGVDKDNKADHPEIPKQPLIASPNYGWLNMSQKKLGQVLFG